MPKFLAAIARDSSNVPGMKSKTTRRKLRIVHRASGDSARAKKLGPYEIETLIAPRDEGAATAYRVRIALRKKTAVSFHKIAEELYFVIAGRGTAILSGKKFALRPGDLLRLPPGTKHGFVTAGEPLDMLNIHTPGCRPDHDVYFVNGPAPDGFKQA